MIVNPLHVNVYVTHVVDVIQLRSMHVPLQAVLFLVHRFACLDRLWWHS